MATSQKVDALFFSYYEDIDRWHNDYAPSASGPTGKPALLMDPEDPDGLSILARTARQCVSIDGGIHDFARYLSLAHSGHTADYRRFEAFSMTHLSGAYFESLARRNGFDVRHINHATRVDLERLGQAFEPRLVMFSTTFMTEVANVLDAMQHIRRAWPKATLVVGGLFLVELQKAVSERDFQRLLISFGAHAYVITPQGEASFLALLKGQGRALNELDLPGTWLREGRTFAPCSGEEPNLPIDDNWVRWDELEQGSLYHAVHTRTARSCAFVCSFCSYPANQGPLTLQSPETLEEELRRLERVGHVGSLIFTDDTFNVPPGRFKELCRVLARHDFQWYSFFRSQFADEETVRLMVDSGCQGAFLGYESLDDQVLKNMKKAVTRKAYERGTAMLKRHGIACHANFIIGFPGDKRENTLTAMRFLDEHGIEFFNATPWYCSPATPIWSEREAYGVEGAYYRWKHDTMAVEEAIELEDWCRTATKHSVWMSELGARNFWTELFLYSNGCSVHDAQRMVRTFNQHIGRELTSAALAADCDFAWLGQRLRELNFPSPPGEQYYQPAQAAVTSKLKETEGGWNLG